MNRRHKFLLFRVYRFRDTEAYGELYDFYVTKIRRFIAFRIGPKEDVEEVTAEVFLRGWEYATSSVIEKPGALFYRIARNAIADHYRKIKGETQELNESIADEQEPVDVRIDKEAEAAGLLAQLKTLKEEYRDLLMMRYLDELSIKQIAEALEKTPNNVRVGLYRAKKALQKKVKQ